MVLSQRFFSAVKSAVAIFIFLSSVMLTGCQHIGSGQIYSPPTAPTEASVRLEGIHGIMDLDASKNTSGSVTPLYIKRDPIEESRNALDRRLNGLQNF